MLSLKKQVEKFSSDSAERFRLTSSRVFLLLRIKMGWASEDRK